MEMINVLQKIESDPNCKLLKRESTPKSNLKLPSDLKYFYENYDSLELFANKPYGIRIVSLNEFIPTNKRLYPEDDIIWEELEDDISNEWFLIAESAELSQYISIDLRKSHLGYCYDSFLETHATPDENMIIAKSFTELLEKLYSSNGEDWFWLDDEFEPYGDAYDEE
ncbi:SMI1/KNR4 family protein [Flavobacterium sharifuzzamanii]|uniref:SMI1/KNR4 family protein n=1 Tax=Flavobacterium sharifuzzamanii TaxID=2211133 RepID=UPI000DAEEFFE|nr:SMI1/KNR4 family protein [Flavobacterium sharifuzzamanii]KAF2080568.1 SMI1/KNR4 family protein [Flavobacterium sharifuzzamanii]